MDRSSIPPSDLSPGRIVCIDGSFHAVRRISPGRIDWLVELVAIPLCARPVPSRTASIPAELLRRILQDGSLAVLVSSEEADQAAGPSETLHENMPFSKAGRRPS